MKTITVNGPIGPLLINEEDFNPEFHERITDENKLAVTKEGKKFFVVNSKGQKIEGFEEAGYSSNEAAWSAIKES